MLTSQMDNADALEAALARIERVTDSEWLSSLDGRKLKELEFHDRDRDRNLISRLDQDTYERFYGNKKYYQATALSKSYVDEWIRINSVGRVFLDYACGNGVNAIKAAQAGAALSIGIDISQTSVENARRDALAQGVSRTTRFVQADAENTLLPNDSIDLTICSGMLHHLDLSFAFPELRRILKPGGKILAVEALDYNPLIKLYRRLTPDMRTEWEKAHILSHKDIRFAERFFNVSDVRYWHLSSIMAAHFPALLPVCNALDKLLTSLPLLQMLAWMFTFVLTKPSRP